MSNPYFEISEKGKVSLTNAKSRRENPSHDVFESHTVLTLIENLDLLMNNYEKILNTPEYYFILIEETLVSTAYVGYSRNKLYLGELLRLWHDGKWTFQCPDCSGTVYIRNVGGSPLSGCGSGSGYCDTCKGLKKIERFSLIFGQYRKMKKVEKGDEIIPSTVEELLAHLKA